MSCGRRSHIRFWFVGATILILAGSIVARICWKGQPARRPFSGGASQSRSGVNRSVASECRSHPVRIDPVGDFQGLVAQDDLRHIVIKAIPRWPTFKFSRGIHALRLWGPDAAFDESKYPTPHHLAHTFSGQDLVGLFLDHQQLLHFVPDGKPILLDTQFGVGVKRYDVGGVFEGATGHIDQLISTLGLIGYPSGAPIRTPGHVGTVAELIADAQARFDPAQELEWTAEAFALYLAPRRTWTNRFGETFSFDDVARRLLDRPRGHGTCFGTHVPQALMVLWRVDQQESILDPSTRQDLAAYFEEVSDALVRFQEPEGYWPTTWIEGGAEPPVDLAPDDRTARGEKIRFLTSTSHHLEWIALAPPELRPPDDAVERATVFLAKYLRIASVPRFSYNYLPITHGVRALCLMENKSPMEILDAPSDLSPGVGESLPRVPVTANPHIKRHESTAHSGGSQ